MAFYRFLEDWIHTRLVSALIAVLCASLMGAALYFQYYENMDPCPLCIFQRIIVIALGVVFFIRALHGPIDSSLFHWFYYGLGALISALGIFLAGRHVWLQNLPAGEVPECGPSLDYLMDALPFLEVIDFVLNGSGECAKVSWTWLGMSMPAWLLLIFIGFGLFNLLGLLVRFNYR